MGLTIRNFLSVGNAVQSMRFDQNSLTLVLGHNSDATNGSSRNGAGKSAILQALSFALYGKPLTKIKIPNLVNNINQRGMHVTIDFEKGGKVYRIERGRNPTIMKFYINDEEITDGNEENDAKGENAETQVDINRIIGMSHTMFKHIVALNTYTEPFLRESESKQREIIEELLGITQMSAKAAKLKEKMMISKDRIKTLEAQLSATRAANTRIEQSIERSRKESHAWEAAQNKKIAELEEALELTNSIDFDKEIEIFDKIDTYVREYQRFENELALLEEQMRGLVRNLADTDKDIRANQAIVDSASLEQTKSKIKRERDRHEKQIEVYHRDAEKFTNAVAHYTEMLENPNDHDCRTCSQKLTGTDHLNYVIRRFEEDRADNEKKLSGVLENITSLEQAILDLDKELNEAEEKDAGDKSRARDAIMVLSETHADLTEKIEVTKLSINALRESIRLLNGKPVSIFDSREQVYGMKYEKDRIMADIERLRNEDDPHIKQINGFMKAIQKISMDDINNETDLLKHQEFLYKLLTSKDSFIRRTIIDQNLSFLNDRLNYYLTKLGLPHELVFQSDLSVGISLLGRDYDFAQLSRGEGNRVILAMSWAFRNVWESLNNRVNLFFLDEVIDSGVCNSGAEDALQVLKEFGRNGSNVFLVSHRDELVGRIDNVMTVYKENGFTNFAQG